MSEDANHRYARHRLEQLGLRVEEVPTRDGELRADYLAFQSSYSYVIEVKGPGEDESSYEELVSRGIATRIKPDARTNPLSKKIRTAARQLEATPAPKHSFRLIVLVTGEQDSGLKASQYLATLYGIENLIYLEGDEVRGPTKCYYFTFNEFFELEAVEAAIIMTPTGSRLCPNTFADRYGDFVQSELYAMHLSSGAVQDPLGAEEAGEAFVADTDLDRHDQTQILDFVRTKYSLRSAPTVIPLQQIEQQIVVGRLGTEGENLE
jgi:hypothetical protein